MTDKALHDLVDALRGPAGNTGPGTGHYPVSHALYDIAQAINEKVTLTGDDLKYAFESIASAIDNQSSMSPANWVWVLGHFLADCDGQNFGHSNNITAAIYNVGNALHRIADQLAAANKK